MRRGNHGARDRRARRAPPTEPACGAGAGRGAVCRQRWTVRLGEVEPVFGQTGRVVLDGSLGYDGFWLDEGATWQPSGPPLAGPAHHGQPPPAPLALTPDARCLETRVDAHDGHGQARERPRQVRGEGLPDVILGRIAERHAVVEHGELMIAGREPEHHMHQAPAIRLYTARPRCPVPNRIPAAPVFL